MRRRRFASNDVGFGSTSPIQSDARRTPFTPTSWGSVAARSVRPDAGDGGRFESEVDEAESGAVTLPAGFRMGAWLDVGGKASPTTGRRTRVGCTPWASPTVHHDSTAGFDRVRFGGGVAGADSRIHRAAPGAPSG